MSCNCGQLDLLYNFISPITGRILADPNYVLVGNRNGIAIPSPILIDVRLDLIALRKRYNTLVKGDIVIGKPNNELPNAQVLFNLDNGYLYTTDGILSTNSIIPIGDLPDLEYKHIWIGDVTNRPVPQQRVTLDNLTSFLTLVPTPENRRRNFGLFNLYTGKSISLTDPLGTATPDITMRLNMSNLPNVKVGRMLLAVSNIIPPVDVSLTPPYLTITADLNWDPRASTDDNYGVLKEVGLNAGEMFIGDPANTGQIMVSTVIPSTALPDLPNGAIWRGDINNRPAISFSLGQLETRMTSAENAIIALQGAVGQLEIQIGALQTQIGALDTALGLLAIEVQTIATTVAGLVISVATLGTTVAALGLAVTTLQAQVTQLFNRTLDQIPLAVADVNLNGHKIINLADATNAMDAVNLQTMQAAISTATGGLITSVTGTANQITANTVAGAVTLSLPSTVIISTSLAAGNLELTANSLISTNTNGNILLNPNGTGNIDTNNHKIINLADPTNPLDAVNYQSMTALTNRTLDQIPLAVADVDINNNKLINVSDPTNPLDAVNLQTLNAAVGAGVINSVTGTANQITANTVSGAVTLSLPSTVIITTSVAAANMELNTNVLQSNNTNGSISISPNGSGNLLLIPSPGTGLVGVKGTPSYPLDVFGITRTQRLMGNTAVTVAAGATSVTGTGRTINNDGSEVGGSVTLNTGTGISGAGTTNPLVTVTLATAMPSTAYCVVVTPGSLTAAGLPLYIIKTTTSAFTIRCSTALTNSTSYTFNYHVIAN